MGRGAGGGGAARPRHRAARGGPDRRGATGRNGGFCAASLTHGLANGHERFADELPTLLRMGRDTLDAIEAAVARHGIDCDFERTGELDVASAWQVEALAEEHALARVSGLDWQLLDREQIQAEVASPTYLAALDDPDGVALVDPARLAWGLAAAAERLGVRIFEHTPATGLDRDGAGVGSAPRTARSARPRSWWPRRPAAAAALDRGVRGAGLGLRPDDRAARARRPRRARLGPPAGDR